MRIGQIRHFGLRAVHSVAPKSISAWLKSNTCRVGQDGARHCPQSVGASRALLSVAAADEDAKEHARDVGVEDGGALAEGEAEDGAGGVGANALEREQRLFVRRGAVRRTEPSTRGRWRGAAAGGCCNRAAATWRTRRVPSLRPAPRATGTSAATPGTSAARDPLASAAASLRTRGCDTDPGSDATANPAHAGDTTRAGGVGIAVGLAEGERCVEDVWPCVLRSECAEHDSSRGHHGVSLRAPTRESGAKKPAGRHL